MKIFQLITPRTAYTSFNERAKFSLTFRTCFLFSIVIGTITTISYISRDAFFYHYLGVFILSCSGLIYMHLAKKYQAVSIVICSFATIIIYLSVFQIKGAVHIIEALWMIVIVLFSFFTLNKWWGFTFIFFNVLLYVIYFNTYFFSNLQDFSNMTSTTQIIMSVEFTFTMFLIGFIMHHFHEVTEHANQKRRKAYEQLSLEKAIVDKQNIEKTALLQEIHHRVKNNLQVIISLLRIQSSELQSDEAKVSFDDAITRIMTMSLIHQKMYEKEALSQIDLSDYLSTLFNDVIAANYRGIEVTVEQGIQIPFIGPKTIVPVGLIVNELVSNSMKHAFNNNHGKIEVAMKKINSSTFTLTYRDDGTWKDNQNSSFGLQLIEVFTEQLDGTYERCLDENGTTYNFLLRFLD
ncbi:MAG: sensor histidine kinase [Crocinitomicaceae bacterium]|nr:sensor histidine kinase [Crocinitomicaceae bacterium]